MRVAINGFGRIGKQFFLAALERNVDWEFVINQPSDMDYILYSLKHDSVHPSFRESAELKGKNLIVGKRIIPIFSEKEPAKLPWKKEKIDLVIECSGFFTDAKDAAKHIKAGASKVLISAPGKNHDATIIPGVNDSALKKSHKIVSAGSCTTNCVAPILKVLNDEFGIINAQFLTAHAYTSTQRLIDGTAKNDPGRGRAAAINIVPSSSGASISVSESIPELEGKITGYALRVPVIDGSIANVYAAIKKRASESDINRAFKKYAVGVMKGIMEYSEESLVSSDIINNPSSCIFDSHLTEVTGNLIGVAGWYDNEWGYSCRLVDVAKMMLGK